METTKSLQRVSDELEGYHLLYTKIICKDYYFFLFRMISFLRMFTFESPKEKVHIRHCLF